MIKAIGHRVVLKVDKNENVTESGIILTKEERSTTGIVMSKGSKVSDSLNEGDKVFFAKLSGTRAKVNGDELLILREEDILGVSLNS